MSYICSVLHFFFLSSIICCSTGTAARLQVEIGEKIPASGVGNGLQVQHLNAYFSCFALIATCFKIISFVFAFIFSARGNICLNTSSGKCESTCEMLCHAAEDMSCEISANK